MKLATYNIWNTDRGMPRREKYIIREIEAVSPDVVALQEVQSEAQAERLARAMGYPHCFFAAYPDDAEGLCILSRYPFQETACLYGDADALFVLAEIEGKAIGILNLHLPWDSALMRQYQIVRINERLREYTADYQFILGDFNCSDNSEIHRYLLGDCTIDGTEVKPCYFDLAAVWDEMAGRKPAATLNFRENPRFTEAGNTIEVNQRFDRILLRNPHPGEYPFLKSCRIFGTRVYENIGLAASDHYGVAAELEMP